MNKILVIAIINGSYERVSDVLSGVQGIHSVDMVNNHYVITYNTEVVDTQAITNRLEDVGLYIEKQMLVASIEGMSCVMCSKAVTQSVLRLDGVLDINVNYATGKAHIVYTSGTIRQDDIRKKVEEAGYTFLGTEEKGAEEKKLHTYTISDSLWFCYRFSPYGLDVYQV